MKQFKINTIALIAISVISIGCWESKTQTKPDATGDSKSNGEKKDEHDHGADHKAPHGGLLIELGRDHAYHAELTDDHDAKTITIHIMDGHMKPLAIKSPSVSLILTVDGSTESFDLDGVKKEASTEFRSSEEKLWKMIGTKGVTGKLRVTIEDKPVSGTFSGDIHDHGDRGHKDHKH